MGGNFMDSNSNNNTSASYNLFNNKENGLLKTLFGNRMRYGLPETDEASEYLYALELAKQELDCVNVLFNNVSDPDLINYAIYEEYAINLRISYIIKKMKEKNIKSEKLIIP